MTRSFYLTLRHVFTLIAKAIRFRALLDLNKKSFAIVSMNFCYRVLVLNKISMKIIYPLQLMKIKT